MIWNKILNKHSELGSRTNKWKAIYAVHVYADDINIALIVKSSEDLQRMLDTSHLWGKHWRILIQISLFGEQDPKKNFEFTVGSNTCRLEFVDNYYLSNYVPCLYKLVICQKMQKI